MLNAGHFIVNSFDVLNRIVHFYYTLSNLLLYYLIKRWTIFIPEQNQNVLIWMTFILSNIPKRVVGQYFEHHYVIFDGLDYTSMLFHT